MYLKLTPRPSFFHHCPSKKKQHTNRVFYICPVPYDERVDKQAHNTTKTGFAHPYPSFHTFALMLLCVTPSGVFVASTTILCTIQIADFTMAATYLITTDKQRTFPVNVFVSSTAIAQKRFRENTSALAISYLLLLPWLQRVNQRLEAHIEKSRDVTTEELKVILQASSKDAAIQFADAISRIALGTGIACLLYTFRQENKIGPHFEATVYCWDMYPRLNQLYLGNLLEAIRIPRFLSSIFGPATQAEDKKVFQVEVTASAAVQDALKSQIIQYVANILVDAARIAVLPPPTPGRAYEMSTRSTMTGSLPPAPVPSKRKRLSAACVRRTMELLWSCAGAGAGRVAGADTGEFWGSMLGMVVGSVLAARISYNLKWQ